MKAHHILDSPLMVKKNVNSFKKQNEKLFVLNIEFSKVYDSLIWEYLIMIMQF